MIRTLATALALLVPATAHAGACEDGFTKSGSMIGGLKFIASISVPDMTPVSAIGQLRGLALSRNYQVLSEEPEDGSMLIEQRATTNARSFPIIVTATQAGKMGTVKLEAKLRGGMSAPAEGAKTEMCGILNQLKGGKAGLAAAAKGKTVVDNAPPLKITSLGLSNRLSKETQKNAAAIPLRYKGQKFTVDGTVAYVTKDGQFYRVAFDIPEPYEQVLRVPGQANFKTDISCLMAKGQNAYALTLKPRKSIKLTGTYYDFDENRHVMWLSDCRPAE